MIEPNTALDISAALTAEKLARLDQLLDQLEGEVDFLVALTPVERTRLRGLGPKNAGFIPGVLEAAGQCADAIPPMLAPGKVEGFRAATEALVFRGVRLAVLNQRLTDSARVTGDACVGATLDLYQLLKRLGKAMGIDESLRRLRHRFAAQSAGGRARAKAARAERT